MDRIKHAQDVIGRPLTIENAPYPFVVGDRDILTLMTRIAERADCLMTIDVGHLYGLRVQRGLPRCCRATTTSPGTGSSRRT